MRVLITSGTFREKADGVARTLFRLSATLCKEHIHHKVFAPMVDEVGNDYLHVHKTPSIPLPMYRDYRGALVTKSVKKAFAEFDPDIVHIATPDTLGKAALKYARKKNIPVVAAYHTHFPSYLAYFKLGFLEPILWRYLRKFYNQCDVVLAPTWDMKKMLNEQSIRNVELWQRGIEANLFNASRRDKELREEWGGDDTFIVCFAGRLVWYKGLEIVRKVHRKFAHPDRVQPADEKVDRRIRFVFIGDGPAALELKETMPTAVFLGHVEKEEVGRMMASCDLLLFPSKTETFGQVVMEGFACGIPAVVSDQGGPAELVREADAGLVAKADDEAEFLHAVLNLAKDGELYVSKRENGLNYARQHDWDEINQTVLAHYHRLMQQLR